MLFDYEGGRMCVQVESWQVSNACIGHEYAGITQLCMYGGLSSGFLVSNLWYWKCGGFPLKTTLVEFTLEKQSFLKFSVGKVTHLVGKNNIWFTEF